MAYWNYFPPKPTVAQQKKNAEKAIAKLSKKGGCSPVQLQSKTISTSYWGKAWCTHIEGWYDHANRLERGRSYVRADAVVDLRIERGAVIGKVNGSSLYEIRITVTSLPSTRWNAFKKACYGQVENLMDLLDGKLPETVLQALTSPEAGLFPRTKEMKLSCNCPDGAYMCKHVAAVLYGVGSRLDTQPELLFTLRGMDHTELVSQAAVAAADLGTSAKDDHTIKDQDLAGIFGVEMATMPGEPIARPAMKAGVKKKGAKHDFAKTLRRVKEVKKVKEVEPDFAKTLRRVKEVGPTATKKSSGKVVVRKRKDGRKEIIGQAVPIAIITGATKKKAVTKPKGPAKAGRSATKNAKKSVGVLKADKIIPASRHAQKEPKGTKTSQKKIETGKTKPIAKRGVKKVKKARTK